MRDRTIGDAFITSKAKFENSAKVGWWETNYKKDTITVSDYLVHLFDLESPFVTLATFRKYILPECLHDFLIMLMRPDKGIRFKHSFRMLARNEIIWVRAEQLGEEYNSDGEFMFYGYIRQIDAPETNGRRYSNSALTAIKRSEEILRNLFDNMPVGIELYDRSGILVDMNKKDVSMFGGLTKEDILGINIFDHPVLLPEIKEKMRRGEPVDFTSTFDCSLLPDYYESQKYEVFDLTTKISYLYNKDGKLTHYVFTNIDEEETVSAYKRIQEFEAHFAMISRYAKVGYYKWNILTNKGFAIAQWFKNLERPVVNELKDLLGQYVNAHPDDLADITIFFSDAITGKQKSFSKEIRIRKENGGIRWLRCYLMVKIYEPEKDCIEVIGMNFDITELKKVEEKLTIAKEKAETADKLKSSFLANMSHEIRTPLNAIVGFSDVLIGTECESEKQEYMNLIKKNNELLLTVINDILELSKIEAGKFDFVAKDVEIFSLCQHAVDSFNVDPEGGVTMLCRDNLTPFVLRTDGTRMLQVINNLLSNAIKFTKKGFVELEYEIQKKHVIFRVKDTGCGIPATECQRIFGRFEKLDSFEQGTGLGLTICRHIVEKLKGKMGVESELGKGSTFWFTVPY